MATPAIADGNRLFQRHAALLGSTGAGKSWAVATILERAGCLRHPNLIVFDMHGEYLPLTQGADGREPLARRLSIAGPADLASPDDDALYLPYWMLSCEEVLALTLDRTDPHVSTQALRFAHHVRRLKEATLRDVDREDALRTFNANSPVPYRLEHLLSWLVRDDTEKIPQHPSGKLEPEPYAGRLTGLISRLEARMADPRRPPQSAAAAKMFYTAAGSACWTDTARRKDDDQTVPAAGIAGAGRHAEGIDLDPLCLYCGDLHQGARIGRPGPVDVHVGIVAACQAVLAAQLEQRTAGVWGPTGDSQLRHRMPDDVEDGATRIGR